MYRYPYLAFSFVLILTSVFSNIQAQNTSKSDSSNPLRTQFDGRSIVDVEYQYLSGSDYEKKMRGNGKGLYEKGKLDDVQRIRVNINAPIVSKQKFSLSAFATYNYSSTNYDKVDKLPVDYPTFNHQHIRETHYFRSGLAFSYNTILWKKPLVLTASGLFDASDKHLESVNGLFTATMILRRTSNTILGLGLYGTTSRATQIPFFPIFTYRHRFGNSPYMIDIILPMKTYITRLVGKNGRLSGGFSLENDRAYLYPNQDGFKRKYTYDRLDLLMEVKYEHMVFDHFVLSSSAAGSKCYRGVLREKNKTKDIMRFTQDPGLFFKISAKYILGRK